MVNFLSSFQTTKCCHAIRIAYPNKMAAKLEQHIPQEKEKRKRKEQKKMERKKIKSNKLPELKVMKYNTLQKKLKSQATINNDFRNNGIRRNGIYYNHDANNSIGWPTNDFQHNLFENVNTNVD